MIASNFYAIRNVVLELITINLASHFTKSMESPWQDNHWLLPPQIVPESENGCFNVHNHSNYEALDLAQSSSSSEGKNGRISREMKNNPPENKITNSTINQQRSVNILELKNSKTYPVNDFTGSDSKTQRTMTIKRSNVLPQLIIHSLNEASDQHHIQYVLEITRSLFLRQIIYAFLALLFNFILFGGLFAYIENWNFFEGICFLCEGYIFHMFHL